MSVIQTNNKKVIRHPVIRNGLFQRVVVKETTWHKWVDCLLSTPKRNMHKNWKGHSHSTQPSKSTGQWFNPFMLRGIFYFNSLERSISNKSGVWPVCILTTVFLRILVNNANRIDSDQTPHSVLKWIKYMKWYRQKTGLASSSTEQWNDEELQAELRVLKFYKPQELIVTYAEISHFRYLIAPFWSFPVENILFSIW